MNKINYPGKWTLDVSKMDKNERSQLVSILKGKGVKLGIFAWENVDYLECCNSRVVGKKDEHFYKGTMQYIPMAEPSVTVLEMFNLLETPVNQTPNLRSKSCNRLLSWLVIKLKY